MEGGKGGGKRRKKGEQGGNKVGTRWEKEEEEEKANNCSRRFGLPRPHFILIFGVGEVCSYLPAVLLPVSFFLSLFSFFWRDLFRGGW